MGKAQDFWQQLVRERQLSDGNDGVALWYVLDHLYGHPNRYHHNWAHIDEMFARAERYTYLIRDHIVFYLAILFHDAYYIPGDELSVERSAQLFECVGSYFKIGRSRVWQVSDLIKASDHPALAETAQGKLLADLDLLGLSNHWDDFLNVGTKVWLECQAIGVPRSDYVKKAAEFWRSLLERPGGIYQHPGLSRELEQKARQNVARYVEMLERE